jgi:hypothetical protein
LKALFSEYIDVCKIWSAYFNPEAFPKKALVCCKEGEKEVIYYA